MILEVYKGKDFSKSNLIRTYGGDFTFEYDKEKGELIVSGAQTYPTFPCVKLDYSIGGNIVYACTGEED